MTALILTPEQLLASEPTRTDGVKSPFNKEGDRTIKFKWTVGDGPVWRSHPTEEQTTFYAVLVITHHKKGRGAAHYSATLWQHHGAAGSMCAFNGRNGHTIVRDADGAGRFNLTRLQGFAERALVALRNEATDAEVLRYFHPEPV